MVRNEQDMKPLSNNIDVLNKKDAKIMSCKFSDIRHIFNKYHYKKDHIGGGISICFAMFLNGSVVGGSVLGKPRHENKYKKCIDIRRMALLDSAPCNSESYFLGQIIKWVTCNTDYDSVLSYSDITVGHVGTIYKAANFKEIGLTSPTKFVEWEGKTYHPRSLSIERDYSYRLREAVQSGTAEIITGEPKRIWIYSINKKHRKRKMNLENYDKTNNSYSLFGMDMSKLDKFKC